MKTVLFACLFVVQLSAVSQSPYLSVLVKMDSISSEGISYKIEMKFCEPVKRTSKGTYFHNDTSVIKFDSLSSTDITCGEYFEKGLPQLISESEERTGLNQFKFGNQVYAFEKLLVFKVSNWSSRAWHPEMYVVMPVRYGSFVTYIKLTEIVFQPGKVLFFDDYNDTRKGKDLAIFQSLKDHKTLELKDFSFKEMLEAK